MGGRGRSRTQRKHFRQSRENVWKRPKSDDATNATPDDANNGRDPAWEPFATQNPAFDEYYKEQEIVPAEEWDTFIEYLRKPLPAAFRINSSSQFYVDIRLQLENDFMQSLQAEDADGSEVEAIKPLPWYPDNLAWQSNFSRNQLRKNQTLERFHEFLKLENEIGNITTRSFIYIIQVPPLFLDVRPDHFVLDMCAAPGSKTFQLLEMIYKLVEPGTLPSGMVIANDLDVQRCNLLIHQTKRMCTANLIVTNHATLPKLGDGTLRKAPDIWRKWNSGMGNGLHGLQVQIAMRGLALLKVGGRMVYSTCSMNPVENEAVVAEVLRRCGGSIELVDVSTELPQLARRPDVPKYRRSVVTPGMFPSGKSHDETSELDHETEPRQFCENGDGNPENGIQVTDGSVAPTNSVEAEVSPLPLERCMRIVPHDQNSGAFFIAVLHKVSSLPVEQHSSCNGLPLPLSGNTDAGVFLFLFLAPAATEKKPRNPSKETDTGSTQPQELMDKVKDGSNGDDIDLSGEKDVQISEATPDGDLLDTEMGEASLDANQNKVNEENENQETRPSPDVKDDAKMVAGKRKLQIQGRWRGVDPVIFYKDEAVVGRIMEFYGIKDSMPFKGHLITRNNDMNHVKRIYYISNSVKEVLELNFLAGQQLKIASVGLKMFERQTSKEGASAPCLFRISSEGLPLILPHITKQIIYASAVDFKHLLQYKSIKFPDFVDPDFVQKASELMLGCCVVVLKREGQAPSDSSQDVTPIAIGCWRGRTNISVMVTAIDCQELLERVSMLLLTKEDLKPEGNNPTIPEAGEEGKVNGSDIKEDSTEMAPETLD
ncbi:RNA cytosine C(5)-methyltransferase NSUN2 [Sesamum angolense]|uniref:RNA cytosine C(5)-methyltransferase NSUN2 n=1 Tax=Sesamum angolense TaxID=2727404 RepID=A0AAE1WIM6_9LAMI|nr:RNA cytosine C(5)-methyltransferase NSUN2 [Sesamum angolense]